MTPQTLQIVPVLDLLGGVVVRGVGGRRAEYRPVESTLTASAEPLAVAQAFRQHFGLRTLYLADLDAIAGAPPALGVYAALRASGFALWVDAGLRSAADAAPLAAAGVETVVAGLETVSGPEVLRQLCAQFGPDRILFSLDLKNGRPLTAAHWGDAPEDIAARAVRCGVRRLLVLDLASVGEGRGAGTEVLLARLRAAHPGVTLVAGGGVRDLADVRRLGQAGASGVLVASALHDGHLTPVEVAALSGVADFDGG